MPVYFEVAAVITALDILGQVLEIRARSRTSSAIKALLGLAPKTARIVREDGHEEDIPLERVAPGDRLRVRPGKKFRLTASCWRETAQWMSLWSPVSRSRLKRRRATG